MTEMPILVEARRGPLVESRHRGAISAIGPGGRAHASLGDTSLVTFMRSTAKPIQALPLIASGAADRFGFTTPELAVTAASHSGEEIHTRHVTSILNKIGLDESKLRCGTHLPADWSARTNPGERPADVLRNNCSGKHAGMLAQCVAGGFDMEPYESPDHPVQQTIRRTLALIAGIPPDKIQLGIESCGAPVLGLSVERIALAYARLVNPAGLDPGLRAACERIVAAMLDHPELVAGTSNRICTDIMRVCGRAVVAKAGAEGVYTMGVPPSERYPDGLGIALKIEDGGERAAAPAAVETLAQLGLLDARQISQLADWRRRPILSFRGIVVGELRPAFSLPRPNGQQKS